MERITEAVSEFIESESERLAKMFPVRVFLGGEEISLDDQWTDNGEIHVSIENPIFFAKTGKIGTVKIEMPRRQTE